MGLNGDLRGINGFVYADFMGLNGILWGFYGDMMGFHGT
jgi:hypothetical protein